MLNIDLVQDTHIEEKTVFDFLQCNIWSVISFETIDLYVQ
jgi:hypothetical protein